MADSSGEWDSQHLALVRLIYGGLVGLVLIVAGLLFIPHVLEGGVDTNELILVGGICIGGGLLCAVPWIIMPAISKALLAWKSKRNGNGGS